MPEADPDGVKVLALQHFPSVRSGDALAELIRVSLVDSSCALEPGDVLVVSSKVVSKALGLIESGPREAVVVRESVRVVAARRTPRGVASIVQSAAGPVMAAAGVDASNTTPGTVLTLPHDADAVARELRRDLRALGLPLLAVVISDTAGRPWRTGQTDLALGCAGLAPSDDLRGTRDSEGQLLEVTERAVADEVAAAADLAKGKVSGTPVAVVRGLSAFVTADDGPGARSLLRAGAEDWFRYGHFESVRLALGVEPDSANAPHVGSEPLHEKVSRAVEAARHGYSGVAVVLAGDGPQVVVSLQGNAFELGGVCARLLAALWAEDLDGVVERDARAEVNAPAGAASVRVAERA